MANFFTLKGPDVEVTYRIGGNLGFIALTYNDNAQNIHEGFKPSQIDTVHTSLGVMITVAIRISIDAGGTSFSTFLPDITVPFGQSANFNTIGVYKDVRGLIVRPKDVKVTWNCVQLDGVAESIFVPF